MAKETTDTRAVTRTFRNARRIYIGLERIMARKPEHRSWEWRKF